MTKKKTTPISLPRGYVGCCQAKVATGYWKGEKCSNKARYETSKGKFCHVHAIKNLS